MNRCKRCCHPIPVCQKYCRDCENELNAKSSTTLGGKNAGVSDISISSIDNTLASPASSTKQVRSKK